jgi:ribosomal protein S18 acetylase RimI-like enzyme
MGLRLAKNKDLPFISRIFKDAVTDMCSRGIRQWDEVYPTEEHLRSDIKSGHMYVLERKGDIVSAAVINEEQEEEYETACWTFNEKKTAVLHRLCVSPACQNRGYGRETVLLAEKAMKDMGYTAVRLDAFSRNPFALRLYEGLGYARAGEVFFRMGKFFLYEKLLRSE